MFLGCLRGFLCQLNLNFFIENLGFETKFQSLDDDRLGLTRGVR